MQPYISVIVSAYNRRDFLQRALYSIAQQDLNPSLYEVIVITNFHDEKIQKQITNMQGTLLFDENRDEGPFLASALRKARGDVFCFLDDDDEFCTNKLRIVYETFREFENLSYYYNNQEFIDSEGNTLAYSRRPSTKLRRAGRLLVSLPLTIAKGSLLLGLEIDFNMSSISIRRTALLPLMDYLDILVMGRDTFMMVAGLTFPNASIMIDSRKLTRYRIHHGNGSLMSSRGMSKSEYLNRLKQYGSRLLSGYEAIYDLTTKIGNRSASRLMAYKLLDQRIAVSAIGATTGRKQMLQYYVDYIRNMFPSTLARQARMSVLSLAYVISPKLAQQLYLRRTYNQI